MGVENYRALNGFEPSFKHSDTVASSHGCVYAMKWGGSVSKTNQRDWGSTKLWSWQVADSNVWFRTKFDPQLKLGDNIVFEGDSPNDVTSVEQVTPEVVIKGKEEAAVQSREAPPTNSPDYWRWKQMEDIKSKDGFIYRDARHDAAVLVTAALANDVLNIPANLNKGKKYDMFMAIFKEVTDTLYNEAKEKIDA